MPRTIVITGATSGIGNLLVKAFAKQGCIVFAGYRNIKLKRHLAEISRKVIPFKIDMNKDWTIDEAIEFIKNKLNPDTNIDTLINAAGCVCAGPMEYLDVEKIKSQFDVNTFSPLKFTQGLMDRLDGAKIINISSMASFGIFPFVAPYCASKRATDILFNSLEIECGNNIKVISVKPGVIKTPLWEKSIELNKDVLVENKKYQKEAEFLVRNAQKNAKKGLDPQVVVDLILEIDNLENPKASYTVGYDAKGAMILSYLPQDWINFIVAKSLKERVKNSFKTLVDFISIK